MLSDQQKANIEVSGFFKTVIDFSSSESVSLLGFFPQRWVSRDSASQRAHPSFGCYSQRLQWWGVFPAAPHECTALGREGGLSGPGEIRALWVVSWVLGSLPPGQIVLIWICTQHSPFVILHALFIRFPEPWSERCRCPSKADQFFVWNLPWNKAQLPDEKEQLTNVISSLILGNHVGRYEKIDLWWRI